MQQLAVNQMQLLHGPGPKMSLIDTICHLTSHTLTNKWVWEQTTHWRNSDARQDEHRELTPVSGVKLSQGVPGVVPLPPVHPCLVGSRLKSKVSPYMPLQHIHWVISASRTGAQPARAGVKGTNIGRVQRTSTMDQSIGHKHWASPHGANTGQVCRARNPPQVLHRACAQAPTECELSLCLSSWKNRAVCCQAAELCGNTYALQL